jgi:hypothetical protein
MKTITRKLQLLSAVALVIAMPAWAQVAPLSGSGTALGDVTQVTATVDSVDQATRAVTLVNSDGTKVDFVAGPEVRNLAQLAKGDKVTITYAQAVAAKLAKAANPVRERSVSEGMERTALGQKPGGIAMREVRVVASVDKIDTAKNVVTLRGPENSVDVKVRDPAMLTDVKVGDFVEVTYTEAVAIEVTAGK